ncbi:hypothetical protein C8Q76DRAFT_606972, partial [Earliella scabrosa]
KIQEWLPLRQDFLDELLRFHGCEYPVNAGAVICRTCGEEGAVFRCTECASRRLHCESCILARHTDLPLHRLEEWSDGRWKKISLRDLKYVFQLGHDGDECPCPSEITRRLVIGHVTGIHQVQVRFCECLDDSDNFVYQWVQVFRQGWFPATTNKPATAFTFEMLNAFQELNFQGKTNLYDYWKSLERITDNSGSGPSLVLSHAIRLWRHLTALKRGGRAHDPAGAAATGPGELAVECPACPHPGKNLPDGWEDTPPSTRWLYTLFLMVDANFRAKLKDRGLADMELGPGWSYYVENSTFKTHVETLGTQNEKNTCSAEHKAIQNANLRREGYIASGVGAVLCARHAIVRRNAVGDLPNGEKYVLTHLYGIMDYLVFSTLLGVTLMLLISYDIACQWSKKLARRAREDLPPHIRTDISNRDIRYAIPKKHIRIHGPNHSQFSLNFLRWVGRTYGEGIEAHWAHMNPVTLATREMSPGSRREHMDDHWGVWNWQKVLGFAAYLLKCLREAHVMAEKHRAAHEDLTSSSNIPSETVAKWTVELENWNLQPGKGDDPYESPRTTATVKTARLEIAEEEAKEMAAGSLPPHDVLPGVFIQVGLDLEEQHRRSLHAREKQTSSADGSLAELQERRNALMRRIDSWQAIQDVHMPIVAQFRAGGDPIPLATALEEAARRARSATSPSQAPAAAPPKADRILLWLPSALPPIIRASLAPSLADKERRLRVAQADDALEDIRRLRRILTGIVEFKRLNVTGTGQKSTLRVRSLYAKFKDKEQRAAERYRAARSALERLDEAGEWQTRLRVLLDSDLRGPGRDDNDLSSEGRFEISWIWLVPRSADGALPDGVDGRLDPNELLENLKVEWARSHARAERWSEEVELLNEEMRRVLAYFEWRAGWWRNQAEQRDDVPEVLKRGLAAYAEKSASVFEGLAAGCAARWVPYLRTRKEALPGWASRYDVPEGKGKQRARDMAPTGRSSEWRTGSSISTAFSQELLSGEESGLGTSSDEDQ